MTNYIEFLKWQTFIKLKYINLFSCFSLLLIFPNISHATAAAGMVDAAVDFVSELYQDLLPLAILVIVILVLSRMWRAAGGTVIAVIVGGFLFSDLTTITGILNPF